MRDLDETWRLCLEMWKWIAEEWSTERKKSVIRLKKQWLRKNKFDRDCIFLNCFFCAASEGFCHRCPGMIVDPDFSCDNDKYDFRTRTGEF